MDSSTEWVIVDCATVDSIGDFFLRSGLNHGGELEVLTLRCLRKSLWGRFGSEISEGRYWYMVTVDGTRTDNAVPADVVLFGEDAEEFPSVGISAIQQIPLAEEELLCARGLLHGQPKTDARLIAALLDHSLKEAGTIAVGVYDVGQGNCNAIVDQFSHPRLFFDLGWAPSFHAKTRPSVRPNLFVCDAEFPAPVVLSHWDWDHWGFAIKRSVYDRSSLCTRHEFFSSAMHRLWLARAPQAIRHQLTPLHIQFYEALQKESLFSGIPAIQLWPEGLRRLPFSNGWIEACKPAKGRPDDRNNTGLAMWVHPGSISSGVILLPGDADFVSVPSARQNKRIRSGIAGMVAPHHGGRVTEAAIPRPSLEASAKLVFSVGRENSYGHPKESAATAYRAAGWKDARTSSRFACTACNGSHTLGNKVFLLKPDRVPACGCGRVSEGQLCLSDLFDEGLKRTEPKSAAISSAA